MSNKTKVLIGNIITYILGFILILSGILKLIGLDFYVEMLKGLNENYYDNIYLLGVVALLSGLLLVIPKTFPYGLMAALVYFGGTISAMMQAGESFIPQIIFALLAGLAAFLKKPEWFCQKAGA